MTWLRMLVTAGALLALFGLTEHARRRGLSPEVTRRLAHIAGAGAAATFPLYLQRREVLLLAAVFSVLLTYTWLRRSLPSIHEVARPSAGAALFPVGLGLATFTAWDRPSAYAFACLVLALADPVAGSIGQRFGSPVWRVAGGRKTLGGSFAFFAVSLTLGMIFGVASGDTRVPAAVTVSVILTVIEASAGYGMDNLLLPPAAAILGRVFLGL